MERLLEEPLVHFILLGAVLFAASSLISGRDRPGDETIVVTAGKIEHLAALFARTWQRPPTSAELAARDEIPPDLREPREDVAPQRAAAPRHVQLAKLRHNDLSYAIAVIARATWQT